MFRFALCLATLAACAAPPTEPLAQVRVDGFNLDVFRSGEAFEVRSVTTHWRPERDFAYTAILTAERVTGCRVRRDTLSGGPRRIRGRLDC